MEQAAEAAAAAAGGMFSAGALFPLEVIKTNLQAHTKNRTTSTTTTPAAAAAEVEHKEGEEEEAPRTLSAGRDGGSEPTPSPYPPPLPPSPPVDGMCRVDDGYDEKYQQQQEQQQQQQQQQQQRQRQRQEEMQARRDQNQQAAPSVASVARDIHSREGLPGFYKGVWYASGQSGVEKAAYFYGYGWLKALALRAGGGGELSTVADLGLGYLAEAFHLPFTIPIEVVLTKIMTSNEKTNAFAVIQGILAESGPAGFYNGIQAYVVLCLKPAIQYAVFNRLKALVLAYRSGERGPGHGAKELTAVQAFVIGAISRAVATVLVFPYIRAKVIIMSRTGKGAGCAKSPSILASLVSILKEDGVSALFQGIAPEITRGVLSAALMLMVKEKIHAGVKAAIVGRRA